MDTTSQAVVAPTKPWYTSKTLWFNLVMIVGVVLGDTLNLIKPFMGEHAYSELALITGAVNSFFRVISTTKLTA